MSDDNVFAESPVSPLADLVGEDKKFKTVEDLARGKAEADLFIEQLKAEQQKLREDLATRLSVEEALQRAGQFRQPESQSDNTRSAPEPANRDELIALVREVSQRDQAEQISVRNINSVSTKLAEVYGSADKANAVVRAKASELGVTVDFLQSVAAKSPQAFFKQFDIDEAPRSTPGVSHGNVRTEALEKTSSGPKVGTYDYYEEIRKSDPNLYYSPKVQLQLHKEMTERLQRGEPLR